jgi:hypothetical protein
MLQPHLQKDGSSPNPFAAAATAARHPQVSALAAFLASLTPTKLDRLRSLITSASAKNAPLSHESLIQIYSILRKENLAPLFVRKNIPLSRPPSVCDTAPPRLCSTALSILASKRQAYDQQLSFIRGTIQKLLQEYARGHPSEPKYKLEFICGMVLTGSSPYDSRYQVNFMAATKSTSRNTLFFAEFWGRIHAQSKTSICCPLSQPYDMGKLATL